MTQENCTCWSSAVCWCKGGGGHLAPPCAACRRAFSPTDERRVRQQAYNWHIRRACNVVGLSASPALHPGGAAERYPPVWGPPMEHGACIVLRDICVQRTCQYCTFRNEIITICVTNVRRSRLKRLGPGFSASDRAEQSSSRDPWYPTLVRRPSRRQLRCPHSRPRLRRRSRGC